MTNKVYVANLPLDTTEDALRSHFTACGGVLDVELMRDPQSGRARGSACVTMTSPAYAIAALTRHGSTFRGSAITVADAPIRAAKPAVAKVKIVQQFRERTNMAYDLDCAGVPLTVRIFPTEGESWRVEARSTDAADSVVVSASAATRRDALGDVVRAWNDGAAASRVLPLDGEGLLTALRDVRAV